MFEKVLPNPVLPEPAAWVMLKLPVLIGCAVVLKAVALIVAMTESVTSPTPNTPTDPKRIVFTKTSLADLVNIFAIRFISIPNLLAFVG
jgi:hypothetical protein